MDHELDQRLREIFEGITGLAAGIGVLLRSLDDAHRESAYRVLTYQRDTAPADQATLAKIIDVMILDASG